MQSPLFAVFESCYLLPPMGSCTISVCAVRSQNIIQHCTLHFTSQSYCLVVLQEIAYLLCS